MLLVNGEKKCSLDLASKTENKKYATSPMKYLVLGKAGAMLFNKANKIK